MLLNSIDVNNIQLCIPVTHNTREAATRNIRGSQQYLLNIPKTNTQMFGSSSKKSIKDWNEIIRKIHFSSELLFKRAEFIKYLKSTFHDR